MARIILHVEDEPDDALLFQHAMAKSAGVAIHVASDGQAAIDYLQGAGKFANRDEFPLPRLVLLDLKLPLVPGLEVLKWIRQHLGPSIPVVILSSSESEADIAAAYESGTNAYLVKPSDLRKLEEIARIINDFWLIHNRHCPDSTPAPAQPRRRAAGVGAEPV